MGAGTACSAPTLNFSFKMRLITLLLIAFPAFLPAQKHDNNWLFGYESSSAGFRPRMVLNFNYDTMQLIQTQFESSSGASFFSVSDEQGELLFYTAGLSLYGANHRKLLNGDSINFGRFWGLFNAGRNGEDDYIAETGYLLLPAPLHRNLFYVFYTRIEYDTLIRNIVYGDRFYHSVVETDGLGNGRVIRKDVPAIIDTLAMNKLTACKHANGRDWWILVKEHFSDAFYRFLLTSEGLSLVGKQSVGALTPDGLGQAVFSPDGSKYITHNGVDIDANGLGNFLDIYDFDRCTGELSNNRKLNYIDLSVGSGGVAVSPNSRYLYYCNTTKMMQYDLWASDILASVDTIALWDGYRDPAPNSFYLLMLAPDGKIYGSCPSGPKALHVINNPDEKGKACNFEQHGIQMPYRIGSGIPNFPNYRLGALKGSHCDTLLSDVHSPAPDLKYYNLIVRPNPATDQTLIEITMPDYESGTAKIQVVDMLGRILHIYHLPKYAYLYQLDLTDSVSGVYNITLWDKGIRRAKTRLVVVR